MGDDITIGVTEIVNNIEVTAQPNDQIVDISVIDNADDVTLNITPTVIEINVNRGSSFAKWGTILGTLSDQTDLQNALNLKANLVGGKVPASELPSYVDDVVEVADYAALPTTGETGKIYVTLDNNKIYRWSGSVYIEIAANNAIWGAITGTLSSQTDLQSALDTKALKTITITPNSPLSGGGDLSANRTISISQSNTTTDGYLSSTDWNTFNGKQAALNGTGFVKISGTTISYDNSTYALDNAVVHLTGAETITGEKSFNNATSSSSIFVTNSSTGNGVSSFNTSTGNGLYLQNNSTGKGAYINSTSSGIGLFINNTTGATGLPFVIAKSNSNVLTINDAGEITGNKFIKSGGTSSQFLKADGSVDSSTYALDSSVVHLTGAETISGVKTFSNMPILSAASGVNGQIVYADASNQLKTITNFKYNDATGVLTTQLGDLGSNAYTSTAYVPTSRTLTINGTAYDLSADRSWTISGLPSMLEYNDTDKTVWNNGKGNIGTNTSFGDAALKTNTTGAYNTAFGFGSLNFNTTGSANTAVSTYTLYNNTSGYNNTGIGYESLLTNTTGYNNTGVGADALVNNLGGDSNTAVGYGALSSNTSGISNSSVGKYALGANTTGNYNVGIGDNAGNSTLGGGTLNTTSSQSTYIGAFASCSANGVTNEIAIGYASSGNGSNSVTLGNTSITKTILRGNVGIGTTSPASLLTLYATSTPQIAFQNSGAVRGYMQCDSSSLTLNSVTGNDLRFQSNSSDKMIIAANGNVGIGTTSPSYKLDISGGGFRVDGACALTNSAYFLGSPIFGYRFNDSASLYNNVIFYENGTVYIRSLGTGLVYSNGGVLTSTNPSDSRLKEDITDLQYGLNEILKLRPVSYNWKNDNINQGKQFGFIAQEVQEVMPELVKEFETEEGERLGLDKEGIYAALVNAIKELKAEIEILKNK